MKLLYILRIEVNPNLAGVERVTDVLVSNFRGKGISVSYLYFGINAITNTEAHDGIPVFFLPETADKKLECIENADYITKIINENNIDIVINQGAATTSISSLLAKSLAGSRAKLISVLHNTPFTWSLSKSIFKNQVRQENHGIKTKLRRCLFELFAYKNYYYYLKYTRLAYNSSAAFVLLSENYIPLMSKILKVKDRSKFISIPNPLSYKGEFSIGNLASKLNQVLFVGRLEFSQKRIDRLIIAWGLIEKEVPAWKLVIVGGDGGRPEELYQRKEQIRLETLIKKSAIGRVVFAGQQIPKKYYEESKIFCMTSSYEGFPMVLGEAMQHGTVPIAFGSFESIWDIIKDQQNGIIIKPFDVSAFAGALKELIINTKKREELAANAIIGSRDFSEEKICNEWIALFKKIAV